jgi:hypothetical protein
MFDEKFSVGTCVFEANQRSSEKHSTRHIQPHAKNCQQRHCFIAHCAASWRVAP